MRRTDSEMLAYVLPLIGGVDSDLTFVERARNLTGALTAGLRGREAIEAAMGAIVIEKGEALPEPTALELIAMEVERIKEGGQRPTEPMNSMSRQQLVYHAAQHVLEIENWKDEPSPQEELALAPEAESTLEKTERMQLAGVPVPAKGDRVRVVRSAEGWEGWVPEMCRLIGNQYIVEDVAQAVRTHPATVLVGGWHIPASCAELVP